MFRITTISIAALVSMGIASAGQIEIGGTTGLTNAYITTADGGVGSVDASAAYEQNYDNVLFSHATNGVAPVPYVGYTQTGSAAGTMTDKSTNAVNAEGAGGVTFSMIDEGTTTGNSKNFWYIEEGAVPSSYITVPIGQYGVTDVWTLLNTLEANTLNSNRDVTMLFTFGTTASGGSTDVVTVKLNNSTDSTTPTGNVTNSVDCNPVITNPCGGVSSPSSGPYLSSQPNFAVTGAATGASITIDADNLFQYSYTSATGPYANTTGNLTMDDQGFLFGNLQLGGALAGLTNLDTYLVSVQIKEVGGQDPQAAFGLSAVTVDTVVPEPSTVALLLAGFGAIGIGSFRRKKA